MRRFSALAVLLYMCPHTPNSIWIASYTRLSSYRLQQSCNRAATELQLMHQIVSGYPHTLVAYAKYSPLCFERPLLILQSCNRAATELQLIRSILSATLREPSPHIELQQSCNRAATELHRIRLILSSMLREASATSGPPAVSALSSV